MTTDDHKAYAKDLITALTGDHPATGGLKSDANPTRSRNAADAMTTILCNRILQESQNRPVFKANTTFEWKNGVFNCRNITDRRYLWTNLRRNVADTIHDAAKSRPVAYLLACSDPEDTNLSVWAIPEPILFESLATLPPKKRSKGVEYTIEVHTESQRIKRYAESPDLTQFFTTIPLSHYELELLKDARTADFAAKQASATEHNLDDDGVGGVTKTLLAKVGRRLESLAEFDPSGIADARKRIMSSIVRRRGQPKFRHQLLVAYERRCAISGCDVTSVLDAAHIIPYKGPATNHPANGLLLRTDLHTLFDLRLIAVDPESMTVLVSSKLSGSIYMEFHGRKINLPNLCDCHPSRDALDQHRRESGL